MDYTGSIYRLIDRAEDEMKEYAQRVKQLSADEIYRHSAETAAKESLLSALIHDSYELDDDDLDLILKPKNPVEALYQFLTSDKTDLSSESSISSILSEYNAQCQERDLTLGEEVPCAETDFEIPTRRGIHRCVRPGALRHAGDRAGSAGPPSLYCQTAARYLCH